MSFEDPTQRLSVPPRDPTAANTTAAQTAAAHTTTALPRPLDLAGRTPDAPDSPDSPSESPNPPDKTDELSLEEIFHDAPAPADAPDEASTAEAPTWTAMPVIPVRSEPIRAQSDRGETAQTDTKRTGPSTTERMMSDAAAACRGGLRSVQAWLSRDDNGLMLITAIVASILILVVAAAGS